MFSDSLPEFVDHLALVDHHVHGPFATDGDESRFQNALNEADNAPLANPTDGYDSQLGFAVRRWCSELLGLPRHASTAEYWSRRSELGQAEVVRRFTRAAGVDDWLVDTGLNADDVLTPAALAHASGGRAHEVVRLEELAERVLDSAAGPADYVDAFGQELDHAAAEAVAAKSVLAYRGGFEQDLDRPTERQVADAARRWRDQREAGAATRVTDITLIAHGIHTALAMRLPLQLHVGLGDRDLDLRTANPLLLTAFLRTPEAAQAPILLLHCYPFEREAGYLASAFDNVHLDVGLAVNHLGAQSRSLVTRSMELAPFTKVLYSSDAYGPPELHYLGARLWRTATAALLGDWVAADDWSETDARRVATLVGRDNARRVYRLP